MIVIKSVVLFLLAGLCEIGGGYLVWQWLRRGAGLPIGVLGAALLVVYGVLPVLQQSPSFGRVYAAYGGVFIVMSLLWGWKFDKQTPDSPDIWGASICIVGMAVMMFWSRR